MSCCGQTSGQITLTQKDIDEGLKFEVEYWGGLTLEVQGPITGQKYTFSGLSRTGLIDPRDAPGILRNQVFRLKGTKKTGAANQHG
jgi:hypothetical protein